MKLPLVLLIILVLVAISWTWWHYSRPWNRKVVVVVQPFSDMPEERYRCVYEKIRWVCNGAILARPIPIPAAAYYKPRVRYRADSLINWLSRRTSGDTVIIGLTTFDISSSSDKAIDWGIMGLAWSPGRACVASTFRLNSARVDEQYYKVCIHELGHTRGLPHCPHADCYMRAGEGHNHTDEEQCFCASCAGKLLSVGWRVQPSNDNR